MDTLKRKGRGRAPATKMVRIDAGLADWLVRYAAATERTTIGVTRLLLRRVKRWTIPTKGAR